MRSRTTPAGAGRPPIIGADPGICFGAYRLTGSRITISIIVSRFQAGESVRALARDYDIPESHIEEAIRFRLKRNPYRPPTKKEE